MSPGGERAPWTQTWDDLCLQIRVSELVDQTRYKFVFREFFLIFESYYIVHDIFYQCLNQSILSDQPVQNSKFCCMLIPANLFYIIALVWWLAHPSGMSCLWPQFNTTTEGTVYLVLASLEAVYLL